MKKARVGNESIWRKFVGCKHIERGQEALLDIHSDDVGRHFFTHDAVNKFWLNHAKALHKSFITLHKQLMFPFVQHI